MLSFKDYSEIIDNGSYISVKPTAYDNSEIVIKAKDMGITVPNPSELHCTLMYSPEIGIPDIKVDPNKVYEATLGSLALFGERGDYLVVELIDCPELHARHKELKRLGLVPTYPDYRPHITLVDGDYNGSLPRRNTLRGMKVVLTQESHSPLESD